MHNYKDYWENNIDRWAKFYGDRENSEEKFQANALIRRLYKLLILPIEKQLMVDRHRFVKEAITSNLNENDFIIDVGCGSGIYSAFCLNHGAKVLAIDFSETAINTTRKTIELNCLKQPPRIEFQITDIMEAELPESNIVLMIGVSPYMDTLDVIPKICLKTNLVIFHYLSKYNIFNIIRMYFSFLNVRKVNTFYKKDVERSFKNANFTLITGMPIGTGVIEIYSRVRE